MTPKDALRELMARRIKKVMVAALKESESNMYEDAFDYFRSRVLDCANDQVRMLADDFEKFDINFATLREVFLPLGKEPKDVA
jgi:hypothetical protein